MAEKKNSLIVVKSDGTVSHGSNALAANRGAFEATPPIKASNQKQSVYVPTAADLREQARKANDDKYRKQNGGDSLIGKPWADTGDGDESLPNTLASLVGLKNGSREYIKAYMHQFLGLGSGDYDENHLSPQGIDMIRKIAALNYHSNSPLAQEGMIRYPKPDPTGMPSTLGRVAPGNIRKVSIDGVPYWQVLDRYDFNNEAEDAVNGKQREMVNYLMSHGLTNYRSKKILPSTMGLGYNVNFVVPVTPGHEAHPDSVSAFRQKNRLPYPNKTLGNKVVNALNPQFTEKAMP